MKKLLLFTIALGTIATAHAQFCGTDIKSAQLRKGLPEIAQYETQLETQIQAQLKKMDLSKFMRTTAQDTMLYIPVVVHVIHDYGQENVTDDQIHTMLSNLNDFYQLRNNTSEVIAPFQKYIGKANFQFVLATKDPNGKPTKGITRHYSYLTYGHDDQAKLDEWNPSSYMNIWVEDYIGQSAEQQGSYVIAYAYLPPMAAAYPYYDGVIVNSHFISITGNGNGAVVPHEVGHYFNLFHTWGDTNSPGVSCGSDDVDDTPPTKGQSGGCDKYAKSCVIPYFKIYPSSVPGVDSLVDYPDTANVQNIMNYADCKIMFTKGQVARMRATAHATVANRDSLLTSFNRYITGIDNPTPDLPPVADFSVRNDNNVFIPSPTSATHFFLCSGNIFYFLNQSWNDTVSSLQWSFSNDASTSSLTVSNASQLNTPIANTFSTPGWVKVSLTATSNAGSNTITKDHAVYVADPNGIKPIGYYEEFNQDAGSDIDKWPFFNYYGNSEKWELMNDVGFYDHSCIRYRSFDTRTGVQIYTGTPQGDFDDLFTPAFDLSGLATGNCNLNFMYAGAFLTGNTYEMNDTMDIDYSTDCGENWHLLKSLTKSDLSSVGSVGTEYVPEYGDWKLQSIDIPVAARTSNTFFRFRYRPGVFTSSFGSGNDFYLDRFNISNNPLGINTLIPGNSGIAIAPNPTHNNAYVFIKDQGSNTAHITVTDVTGKVVYNITRQLAGNDNKIEIPASAISVKGLYLVQVTTGTQTHTEKLVVL